jgi:serine protease inhibitor
MNQMVKKNVKSNEATLSPVVRATNDLTARWCGRLGGGDFALSGAGLWPLLALLASAGDESARAELAAALGRPADSAQRDALELIDILRTGELTTAALGLWTRKDVPLQQEWASGIPEGVVGKLTDQEALDRWAARETGGLIEKFPLEITPDTALVLASALAARVKWCEPFDTRPRDRNREPMAPDQQWLFRTTYDLGAAAVLDDAVARVIVEGDGDLDVHLLIGDQHPADVLAAGLRELSGEAQARSVTQSDSGRPGLNVRRVESWIQKDILRVELPSFEIKTHHGLLEQTELFGLGSLTDPVTSHLPLLSPAPLYVSDGAQDVVARFFAEGFEAAAVTAFEVAITGAPPDDDQQVTLATAIFDRPFGFLAVHRPSRLAVVAGWVDSPFRQGQA